MKSVAFLTNSIFTCGGEQRVLCVLANELSKYRKITIFTEDSQSIHENPYNLSSDVQVQYFHPFESSFFIKCLRLFFKLPFIKFFRKYPLTWKVTHYNCFAIKKLKSTLSDNYDTVVALSDMLSVLLGFAKQAGLKSRAIGWEHNSFESYFCIPNHRLWKKEKLFIESASHLDMCIVLNEDYAKKYKNNLGISCHVIHNPRSFVSEKKAELKNKIIVTCCVIDIEPKGLDLLIDAFAIFCSDNKDWILQIAGEGQDKVKLEKLVQKNNLQDRVQFLGYRSDIKEILLNASIFVLPSRWEGFPMSLTEAYECGLPAIFFDIPATIPFRKYDAGVVCPAFDTKKYAFSLLQLASDENMRHSVAKNESLFAESISVENLAKEWLKIL